MIKVEHLHKSYATEEVLTDVSFAIEQGEAVGLVGKNGAGKSTLIKILSGAVKATSGQVSIAGAQVVMSDSLDAKRLGIVCVHQDLLVFPGLTVYENLFLGMTDVPRRFGFQNTSRLESDAAKTLERFKLNLDPRALLSGLSVAQQRMLSIARAYHQRYLTRLLILDEPTVAFSKHEVGDMFDFIEEVKNQGVAVLYVSHRLDEVLHISDRVLVLYDGRLVLNDAAHKFDHKKLVQAIVGPVKDNANGARQDEVNRVADSPSASPKLRPIFSAQNISTARLSRISLDLFQGEIVGLAGLTGSGRSSVLRAIAGVERIIEGSMSLDGHSHAPRDPSASHRSGIWFIPEDRKRQLMFSSFEIWEDLMFGNPKSARGFIGQLSVTLGLRSAERTADDFKIQASSMRMQTTQLSGGNQQKAMIARTVQVSPKVLCLDEPTQGVDIEAREQILSRLRELTKSGLAVLCVVSDFEEMISFVDRILLFKNGRLVGNMPSAGTSEKEIFEICSLSLKSDHS